MRVGSELKAARKKAGITVEVISKRTKISVNKLIALEKNNFKNLPTGLYLFSTVRAYAREVHIDPEPIVERLRTEFADADALDALHALDATGALDTKKVADASSSKGRLRNAAIAAGVLLMAAGGAGVYLYKIGRTVNSPSETLSASLSSPAPLTPVASVTLVDEPQQAPVAPPTPAPTKNRRPKPRPAAVIPPSEETAAVAESPANIEEPKTETPELATAP